MKDKNSVTRLFGSTLVAAVPGKILAFFMAMLLGRILGPSEFGAFIFAQGLAIIAAQFAALGWPTMMLRLMPTMFASQDWPRLNGLLRAADRMLLSSSAVIGGGLIGVGFFMFQTDARQELAYGLIFAGVILPAIAFRSLSRQQLAAWRKSAVAIAVDEIIPPLGVLIVIMLIADLTAGSAILSFGLASLVSVLVARYLLRGINPLQLKTAGHITELKVWNKIAVFCLIGTSAKLLMNKSDILMLAPLSTLDETGIYGAAFRLTYLLTFPQVALSMIMSPRYAVAHKNGDLAGLRKALKQAFSLSMLTTCIVVIPILFFSEEIMNIVYGQQYAKGGEILLILALSQCVSALVLPLSSLGMMTGRERFVGSATVFALCVNILLNFKLIPELGAFGAASASLATMVCLFLVQIWFILRPTLRKELK